MKSAIYREPLVRLLPMTLLVVAFAGLFAAGVLSAGHLLDLPVPCGRSRGCLTVAQHPSSRLFGVPIAFIGVAAYLTFLFLLSRAEHWARVLCVTLSGIGTVASGVLLFHSHTVIRATCAWCVASGIAMTLLFVLSVLLLKGAPRWRSCQPTWVWVLAFVTASGIGVQAGLMQRAASRPPIAAERLARFTETELVGQGNSLGPPDAPLTIVMFSDLWCPACRAAASSLIKFQAANPAAVRFVYRHLPFWEIRGHEFSGTAAALSEIAAEEGKFWSFVDLIHRQGSLLDSAGHVQLMRDLGLATTNLEARLSDLADPAVTRVQRDMALANQLGINATPTFILLAAGQRPVSASPRMLSRLLQVLQKRDRSLPGDAAKGPSNGGQGGEVGKEARVAGR